MYEKYILYCIMYVKKITCILPYYQTSTSIDSICILMFLLSSWCFSLVKPVFNNFCCFGWSTKWLELLFYCCLYTSWRYFFSLAVSKKGSEGQGVNRNPLNEERESNKYAVLIKWEPYFFFQCSAILKSHLKLPRFFPSRLPHSQAHNHSQCKLEKHIYCAVYRTEQQAAQQWINCKMLKSWKSATLTNK